MSMYKNLIDIVQVFRHDEELLRLLHYEPENIAKKIPDPLDVSLPNILDIDDDWKIRDNVIKLVPKTSNLEEKPICRIYLYAGRRDGSTNNYLTAKQQIVVDVLCHTDFEQDIRSTRICDKVNDLLVHSRITGFGKIDYLEGTPISAPVDFIGYRNIYEVGSFKK